MILIARAIPTSLLVGAPYCPLEMANQPAIIPARGEQLTACIGNKEKKEQGTVSWDGDISQH